MTNGNWSSTSTMETTKKIAKKALDVLFTYIGNECENIQDLSEKVNDENLSERLYDCQYRILVIKEIIQEKIF